MERWWRARQPEPEPEPQPKPEPRHDYVCEVCFEPKPLRSKQCWPRIVTGNGQVLRAGDCGHDVCAECMTGYLTSRVAEGSVFGIRCPHPGCTNEICEADAKRMAPAAVAQRFAELRARDFSARAQEIAEGATADYGYLKILWETARLCPRCSVVIQRSKGCDHFYCVCGHSFNWQQAPRPVGGGMKKYSRVISLAESLGISLSEAERIGGGKSKLFWKGQQLATTMGCSPDEATEIHKRAFKGDQLSRDLIRAAREGNAAELRRLKQKAGMTAAPERPKAVAEVAEPAVEGAEEAGAAAPPA